jgi:hypothetical protein
MDMITNQLYPPSIVTAIPDGLFCPAQRRSPPRVVELLQPNTRGRTPRLGYCKLSNYDGQHKKKKSIHCLIGIRNQDPRTQGEERLPRRPDSSQCYLFTCGSANEKVYPRRPRTQDKLQHMTGDISALFLLAS